MTETITVRKRHSTVKNAVFVAVVVFGNSFGNLLLAIGLNHMPAIMATAFSSYLGSLLANVHILSGTVLLIVGMIAQLFLFTWADLTYVLPITASGYIITALLGKFVLYEDISLLRWLGVIVISLGVMLVSGTPVRTHEVEPGEL